MEIEIVRPEEIEKRSFAIISEELKAQGITLPEDQEAVTKRCIHTSADFDYARNLTFSEGQLKKQGSDPSWCVHRHGYPDGPVRHQ